MSNVSTLGRPADRTNLIVRSLRERIVSGELAPGAQLPTRAEIEADFGAGATTVQRALEHLRRDGFIEVNGRQGTFVVDKPPHLTNYALVFPGNPSASGPWPRFWGALNNEALAVETGQDFRLHVFYNVDKSRQGADFRRLIDDVCAHRLAGLIFACDPHILSGTPLVDEPGLRRVAIMSPRGSSPYPSICPDMDTFWQRAADYLLGRGRRRVAILLPPGIDQEREARIRQRFVEQGFHLPPYWIQGLNSGAPRFANHSVQLLLNGSQKERPDALIIADDNFIEHAVDGLVASGLSIPGEVEVLAHCNYPHQPHTALPLRYLGFDARQILRTCMEFLRAPETELGPERVAATAKFVEELDPIPERTLESHL